MMRNWAARGGGTAWLQEVLRYLNKLYAAGLLDPDYATNTKDQWSRLSSGRAVATFDNDGVVRNFNAA